ncbi:hypothetical protein [Cupriavidus pauculus]|uniref:hypothetical protein n=1 Tax=Cupriavidus pauculus TaxID=82633 RepID=UPI0011AF6169|nr:hypothetical protein [Cupriavidus pauculus]
MINDCRPAVRAFGIALLFACAGQAYAQVSHGMDSQGLRGRADACAEIAGSAKPAVCEAADHPASSKYNLLYADDGPAYDDEDASPSHRHGRNPRDEAHRGRPRNEATGS